jgi:hypothetical protein
MRPSPAPIAPAPAPAATPAPAPAAHIAEPLPVASDPGKEPSGTL